MRTMQQYMRAHGQGGAGQGIHTMPGNTKVACSLTPREQSVGSAQHIITTIPSTNMDSDAVPPCTLSAAVPAAVWMATCSGHPPLPGSTSEGKPSALPAGSRAARRSQLMGGEGETGGHETEGEEGKGLREGGGGTRGQGKAEHTDR